MRGWLFLLIPFTCFAEAPLEEEALSLRRIADFWQEGEYHLAKNQIETYLNKYPDSSYYDTLCAALGDLCLREKNYSTALDYYSRILDPHWQETVFLNRMQCLYHLEWYVTLADECDAFLTQERESEAKTQATYYLAIGLYQQCLNAANDPVQLETLALRAQPHFTTLIESTRSIEVSQAFAYLCCILKEFPKASNIYLELAEQDESQKANLLFQAAVLQSGFDKDKASDTFKKVADLKQDKAKDAAFNYLVLNFEMNRHELLIAEKEQLLQEIDAAQEAHARLLFGQSYFQLNQYPEAVSELSLFSEAPLPYETIRPGLIYLIAAAFKSGHLPALEKAIDKLDPADLEQPQALFARGMLLKKEGRLEKATEQFASLLAAHAEFSKKPQALFELIDLEYQTQHWKSCRSYAEWFTEEYPSHDLTAAAWRYLISSATQLCQQETLDQHGLRKQLTADLDALFAHQNLFAREELCDWQFLLAKTCYELHDYPKAKAVLNVLMEQRHFPQLANSHLLMALLEKETSPELFCQYAEQAIALEADLVDKAQLHIALFNAYLERSEKQQDLVEQAAQHLFSAFVSNGTLQTENLDWLATYYYHLAKERPIAVDRAIILLEKCNKTPTNIYKLAKLYARKERTEEQVALLEQGKETLDLEAKLLLAEGYARLQKKNEAIELFDDIVAESPTIRTFVGASACLQGVLLKQKQGSLSCSEAATCLKNLILQRRLSNEPIHLEAAIEYIDLQSENNVEKRLSLLKKTKTDFESTEDLLSKDYHEARQKLPEKDHIYRMYICLFDADIYLCQAQLTREPALHHQLKTLAEELLVQIKTDPIGYALLGQRVDERLQRIQINFFDTTSYRCEAAIPKDL
ncbi:MAG TPA: hypothetical protein DCE71_07555 [Parachlamydiales bacterium]|nr:hypothetical protein [Parachlamydiales bacterium]